MYRSISAEINFVHAPAKERKLSRSFRFFATVSQNYEYKSNQDKLKMVFAEFKSNKFTKLAGNAPGKRVPVNSSSVHPPSPGH